MNEDRREHVYDTEMNPLVAQLIAIAKREGIPLLVSAGMTDDEGDPLYCTTLILHGREHPHQLPGTENRYGLAVEVIRGHEGFDTAAGMIITRHHPPREVVAPVVATTPEPAPDADR